MSEPNAKEGAALTPSFGGDTAERRPNTGWRIAIVFVAVTLIWLGISALAHVLFGAEYNRPAHLLRAALTSVLVVPLIALARRFLDQRSWDGLGLSSLRSGWKPLLVGIFCWLIPALIGIAASLVLGWTTITLVEPLGDTLLFMAGLALLVFFYEALPEELIFRGYFYTNLATRMPLWLAVVGQAVLFTLWGLLNGGENSLDRSLLFFTFAIIVGIFRVITGSIWVGIGFHLVFQTFAQLFGSVGSQFTTSSPAILTIVAFGILPFAFSITILRWFYPQRPNWRDSEPDPRAPIKEVQP